MKIIYNIIIALVIILIVSLLLRYTIGEKDAEITNLKAQNKQQDKMLARYATYLFELEKEAKNASELIGKQAGEIDSLRRIKYEQGEKPQTTWNVNENLAFFDAETGDNFDSAMNNDSVITGYERIQKANTKFIHLSIANQEITKLDSLVELQEIQFEICTKQSVIKDSIIDIRSNQYSNALVIIKKQDTVIKNKDRRIKIERIISGSIIVIIAAIALL